MSDSLVYGEFAGGQHVNVTKESLDIHTKCVHDKPLNVIVHREPGNTTTLAGPVPVNAYSMAFTDATDFPVGTLFSLTNTTGEIETVLYTVMTRTGNLITTDMRVGIPYSIGTEVKLCIDDLTSAAGSMATPMIYEIGPPIHEVWHIWRFLLSGIHDGAMDDSMFGSIAGGLTNGITLRASSSAGWYYNYTSWRTNGDMVNDMFDVVYSDKAGGGLHGLRAKAEVKRSSGAVMSLDGGDGSAPGDKIQFLVQDAAITDMNFLGIKLQGHFDQ